MADAERAEKMVRELLREVEMTRGTFEKKREDIARLEAEQQRTRGAVDAIAKRLGRPGAGFDGNDDQLQARALLEVKQNLRSPKRELSGEWTPSAAELEEAQLAIRGAHAIMHALSIEQLDPLQRKTLSSFNLGSSGFILPPEMSSTVLSCLEDQTDVAGIMGNLTIAGSSVKFLVDNAEVSEAAWACESECFPNTASPDIVRGLGELEIRPETLRFIVCTSRDVLEDSSIDIEAWILQKASRGFRNTISNAIISGDGAGKPLGFLNPSAGIPICETSAHTPVGAFTWQDLIALKYQVPMQYHGAGGAYLMNQNTFSQVLTMSDANGRPIMLSSPTEDGQFRIAGSPVRIVTQIPDVAAGTTPVAFGNWKQAYMVVNRKAVTLLQDPYSAGFCVLFKFEARVGGAVICPNAARLLRIR
jgi:HK97 family phage major capsid protein